MENLTQTNNNEMERLTMIIYRSLTRMHNIFISIIHYISMPPNCHVDLAQLAYELLRTIYQLPTQQVTDV